MSLIHIGILLLGAVVGAALALVIPAAMERSRYAARRDLLGSWFSSYQQYQGEASKGWVEEKIDIRLEGAKFLLESSDNSIGEYCRATATLHAGELLGKWASIRHEGGNAYGGMLLTVLPEEGVIYGIFSGPRDSGQRIHGAWVMARKEEDLAKAKRLVGAQILEMNDQRR
jgi:hypothetical protein